jgi:hypothetical protein
MSLIYLLVIVLVLAVAAGAALLRVRRSPANLERVPVRPGVFHGLRERGAPILTLRWPPRRSRTVNTGLLTRPDLQPAQALELPGTRTLVDDWPVGLAVTALATGSIGYPPQDVYYVQRNIIALARGLSSAGVGPRAAALTLSAVMTSPVGRNRDADEALRQSVRAANRLVRSVARREPGYSDMATTLDVVFVAFDGGRPSLHFAHVGNASIWLQRTASRSLELLTESHAINNGGPLLRAVGVAADVVPDIGLVTMDAGDRIFLTTASRYFAFSPRVMNTIAIDHTESPLQDCVAALADAVRSSAAPEGVMIVAAEVARPVSFLA